MGGKKSSSFDKIQLVIWHYEKGKTHREIQALLQIPRSTVGDIILRYKNEDRLELRTSSGRRRILTPREELNITNKVKADPKLSAPKLAKVLRLELNKDVSAETVRRVLRRSGLHGRIARKKPFISEKNRIQRYNFAKEYVSKPEDFWKNVLFADECM